MKKIAIAIVALWTVTAQAAVYNVAVTADAHDLKVVSAQQTLVPAGWVSIPNNDVCGPDSASDCGFDSREAWKPGLHLEISYVGKDAGVRLIGGDDAPISTDQGDVTLDLVGQHSLVSMKIVKKMVQKEVADDANSTYCATNEEGYQVDDSCVNNYATKQISVEATLLEITTQ